MERKYLAYIALEEEILKFGSFVCFCYSELFVCVIVDEFYLKFGVDEVFDESSDG